MKNVIVAGAAPDTGNLGVSALCDALVNNLIDILPEANIGILDFGTGIRKAAYPLACGKTADLIGAKNTKRIVSESSFFNIFFQWSFNCVLTETAKRFKNSVVLDVSGGDSFTDLYGSRRLKLTNYPKDIAIKSSSSLILMPQTIGPFENEAARTKAIEHLKYSDLVYTRDKNSFDVMKKMLGNDFDEKKHKQGVDMAFLLEADQRYAKSVLPNLIGKDKEFVGINVSGLIYNNKDEAATKYSIKCNYNKVIRSIVEEILNQSDLDVLLVPHVLVPEDSFESDYAASLDLIGSLSSAQRERVKILEGDYNQNEVKGVIAKCKWFCGTRMHATIAGLSSAVPTVNIAYSGKSKGVFESVNQGEHVLDARFMTDDELLHKAIELWRKRGVTQVLLEKEIKTIKQTAVLQMQEICKIIECK
jgi:polysaccharide pyruvyl transferase WcaK-like protein